jgi:hypothetical protein
MTLQADQRETTSAGRAAGPRLGRRRTIVTAVVAVLVASGAIAGFSLSQGHDSTKPPAPTLGSALHPLTVYRALRLGVDPTEAAPKPGQRTFPALGTPRRVTVTQAKPAFALHIRYAHVHAVRGSWQIDVIAPEGTRYNVDTNKGKFYAAVAGGRAMALFFVYGSADGTNFAIGSGPNPMSRSQAVTLAHSLTSSVLVG